MGELDGENNLSGQGIYSEIPPEIRTWNWGAFWLGWIWGIKNKTYIAFAEFVPFVGLLIPFYLGAKGNELAWSNQVWYDVASFKQTQKRWSIYGWIVGCLLVSLLTLNVLIHINQDREERRITDQIAAQLLASDKVKEALSTEFSMTEEPKVSSAQGEFTRGVLTGCYVTLVSGNTEVLALCILDSKQAIQSVQLVPFNRGLKQEPLSIDF